MITLLLLIPILGSLLILPIQGDSIKKSNTNETNSLNDFFN